MMNQSALDKIGGGEAIFPQLHWLGINLVGNSMALLQFLIILAETYPIETDEERWQVYLLTKCWN